MRLRKKNDIFMYDNSFVESANMRIGVARICIGDFCLPLDPVAEIEWNQELRTSTNIYSSKNDYNYISTKSPFGCINTDSAS
jgi:hypothetical protein